MKIRNGFVSNSSSSSFLIFIDACINDINDFIKMCEEHTSHLDDGKWMDKLTCNYFEDDASVKSLTNREALEKLWFNLYDSNHIANKESWLGRNFRYCNPYQVGGYELERYCEEYNTPQEIAEWMTDNDEDYEKLKNKLTKMAEYWNRLLSETKFKSFFSLENVGRIYEISYSDNDGNISTQMEHGGFWSAIHHLKISEH
jgi:hypothetical protein